MKFIIIHGEDPAEFDVLVIDMAHEVDEIFNHSFVKRVFQMLPKLRRKGVIGAIFVHQATYAIEDCRSHVTARVEIVVIL